MPYILSIDTATPVLSVALHQAGNLLCSIEHHVAKSHSRLLTDVVDHICRLCDKPLQTLDAIAIGGGPGSYTGLRVGLSFAKGICMGTGLPLIATPTLISMVEETRTFLRAERIFYCALLDARKGNGYGVVTDSYGRILTPTKKYKVDIQSFEKWLEKGIVYFVGSGADKYKSLLEKHINSRFLSNIYPKARYMGGLSYAQFLKKDFVDIADFVPWYEG